MFLDQPLPLIMIESIVLLTTLSTSLLLRDQGRQDAVIRFISFMDLKLLFGRTLMRLSPVLLKLLQMLQAQKSSLSQLQTVLATIFIRLQSTP